MRIHYHSCCAGEKAKYKCVLPYSLNTFLPFKKIFYHLISLDDYYLSYISGSLLEHLSHNIGNSKTLADNNLVMKCYTNYLPRKNEKDHTV